MNCDGGRITRNNNNNNTTTTIHNNTDSYGIYTRDNDYCWPRGRESLRGPTPTRLTRRSRAAAGRQPDDPTTVSRVPPGGRYLLLLLFSYFFRGRSRDRVPDTPLFWPTAHHERVCGARRVRRSGRDPFAHRARTGIRLRVRTANVVTGNRRRRPIFSRRDREPINGVRTV